MKPTVLDWASDYDIFDAGYPAYPFSDLGRPACPTAARTDARLARSVALVVIALVASSAAAAPGSVTSKKPVAR